MVNEREILITEFRNHFRDYLSSIKRAKKKKKVLADLFEILESSNLEIFLFGGFAKDIFLHKDKAIPRDVDLVVNASNLDPLVSLFRDFEIGESKFGGFKVKFFGLHVDFWSLSNTWAFTNNYVTQVNIHSLAETTFLNIESIAIEIFPKNGNQREVILDGFISAVHGNELELNLEHNPFPELNIARAIHASIQLKYSLGPKLKAFISSNLRESNIEHVLIIYERKYGLVERKKVVLLKLLNQLLLTSDKIAEPSYLNLENIQQMNLFQDGD